MEIMLPWPPRGETPCDLTPPTTDAPKRASDTRNSISVHRKFKRMFRSTTKEEGVREAHGRATVRGFILRSSAKRFASRRERGNRRRRREREEGRSRISRESRARAQKTKLLNRARRTRWKEMATRENKTISLNAA